MKCWSVCMTTTQKSEPTFMKFGVWTYFDQYIDIL